jgi:replicative DNA helicase
MILEKIQKLNELSRELERKVLAPVIVKYSKDQAAEILTTLTEEDFRYHQSVFNMLKVAVDTKNDLPTMLLEKNIPISDFLHFDYITAGEWQKSIDELRRVSLALSYIQKTSNSIEKTGYKSIEEDIAAHISDLSGLSILKGAKVDSKKGIVDFQKNQAEIAARMESGEKYVGIATGFDYIDSLSEGILPNSLTVIGGYSGAGKTSLAINFIANVLEQKKKVVMFSLSSWKWRGSDSGKLWINWRKRRECSSKNLKGKT